MCWRGLGEGRINGASTSVYNVLIPENPKTGLLNDA